MKKIRDHYFAAWLKAVKNLEYNVGENCLEFNISSKEYNLLYEEYKLIQPVLKEIRNTVKNFNQKII